MDDATNVLRFRSKTTPDKLREWPPEVQELAFQAWALFDDQNCVAVAKRLASGELDADDDGNPIAYEVPARTVQQWAKQQDWPARRDEFFNQNFAAIRRRVLGNLLLAAIDGSQYIRELNAGRAQPEKTRASTAQFAVDRVGFSPVGQRDPASLQQHANPDDVAAVIEETTGKSIADLMALEASVREKRKA